MMHRSRGARALALLCALSMSLSACSSELDPTRPEDAYLIFRDALLAGDAEAVWARADSTTHAYFQERQEQLVAMDEQIVRYMPQADHRLARRQSGVVLAQTAPDGRALFLKVFTPKALPNDEAYKLGSDVDTVNVTEDGDFAKVITRSGQEYFMARQKPDGQWYVMLPRSITSLEQRMAWVAQNQSVLSQTVEELIAEERKEREAVIAELLKKR